VRFGLIAWIEEGLMGKSSLFIFYGRLMDWLGFGFGFVERLNGGFGRRSWDSECVRLGDSV